MRSAHSSSLGRMLQIVGVLARHGVAFLLGPRVAGVPLIGTLLGRFLPLDLSRPQRLRGVLEDIGGTFIKLGQILALQPDVLAVEYCQALFRLLDKVEPFPYSDVERILTEELGRPPEEVFDSLERESLATASVGQVHVGYLNGRKVAVKVQRPRAEIEFNNDLRMMAAMIRTIESFRIRPLYWMVRPMNELISWSHEELDYRYEARYSGRLREYALVNPAQHVPEIYEQYTTRRILVMEFLEGVTLLKYLRARETGDQALVEQVRPPGFEPRRFAANVIDNFLADAFRRGIYHADLHPANLMILRDNVVGYIDFGITGMLSHHARRHLLVMTLALGRGDMETLFDRFLEISSWDESTDLEAYRQGLVKLQGDWYAKENGERRMTVNFTRIMGDMLTLSRSCGVFPERDIVKYIRSAITIDGLVTHFAPSFDVGLYLVEVCAKEILVQGRKEQLVPEKWLNFMGSTGRLLETLPQRGPRLLGQISRGELPVRLKTQSDPDAGLRTRALLLAVTATCVAVLLAFSPEAEPGLNLRTVQTGLLAALSAMLVFDVGRLIGRSI